MWRSRSSHPPGTAANPLPDIVSLEVTSRCNLQCRMCPLTEGTTSSGAAKADFGQAMWHRLLVEIKGTVGQIVFTGFGEPALHPRFPDMLADVDRLGIKSSFATNGAALSQRLVSRLGELANLVHINVSIDSVSPSSYRSIRGGSAQKAIASLQSIVAAVDKKTTVSASAVMMRSTIGGLPALAEAVADTGARSFVMQNLHDQSREGLGESIGIRDEVEKTLVAVRRVADPVDLHIYFEDEARLRSDIAATPSSLDGANESRNCELAWNNAHIDAIGGVYPCCRAAAVSEEKLGDLTGDSLGSIWNGPDYRHFRRRLLDGGVAMPGICRKCTAAPLGELPSLRFAGEVLPHLSRLIGPLVKVAVRNVGYETWTAKRRPCVGTAVPLDRTSTARTGRWLSPNRVTEALRLTTRPGRIAYFFFELDAGAQTEEWFQLVVENERWLPGTRFIVRTDRTAGSENRWSWPDIEYRLRRHYRRARKRLLIMLVPRGSA